MFDLKSVFKEKTDEEIAKFLMTKRISKRKSKIRKTFTGSESQVASLEMLVKSFLTSEAVMKRVSNIFEFNGIELAPELIAQNIVSLLPYKSDSKEVAYDKCLFLASKLRLFFSSIYEGMSSQEVENEALFN